MQAVAPAFADPVADSQAVFRTVMNAFARPGKVRPIAAAIAAPSPLCNVMAAVALSLLDYETPVWLDARLSAEPAVAEWLRFHTGVPVVADAEKAAFAFVDDAAAMPPFGQFSSGTMEYPDRSTTLVVRVDAFGEGESLRLSGPGIERVISFSISPSPAGLAGRLTANRAMFPRGVDLLFVSDRAVAALPRSVRVSKAELQGA
jgi:alpha-D-ribose 1-methylphosphonate 5-triphosphate synthase subunit PhnH